MLNASPLPWIPFLFAGFAAGLLFLPWVYQHGFRLPPCLWREIVGVPCVLCGSTRSLFAMAQGDVFRAAVLNPLFFAMCLGVCVAFAAWLARYFIALRWFHAAARWLRSRAAFIAMGVGAALNWIYLIFTLPR